MEEFYRMSDSYRWDEDTKRETREEVRDAIAQTFNDMYGMDERSQFVA